MSDTLCIIGNGYVGLPLAMAFSKKYETISFSPSQKHIEELLSGYDRTKSFTATEIKGSSIFFTSEKEEIKRANIYIVTVPTPIDEKHKPDLEPIKSATHTVASVLKKGDVVVYESTVYIGCTEELCVPILENNSGLKYNQDFFCGYSPERINPADKTHTLGTVKKIVSGSTPKIAAFLEKLYGTVVPAGIHVAPNMRVAEASKLIENVQRDMNIALMNQLSVLFDKLGVETNDVLDAAATKWNFHRYSPGLVGGHCISVDPYYLIYNGDQKGVDMSLVKTQREINEYMPEFIALKTLSLLEEKGFEGKESTVLILGVAFKENCPDIRNTKVVDIYSYLQEKVADVDIYDPIVDKYEVMKEYGVECFVEEEVLRGKRYDAVIIAVAHDEFMEMNLDQYLHENAVIYDLKSILPRDKSDARL
jgi:UDP-N-acetyl-D-galactosamine dehydrogenase